FFNDPQTTALYTLSLHDALPIFGYQELGRGSLAVPLLAVTERALPLVDELARLGIPCLCERRSDARADEDEHDERDEREAARGAGRPCETRVVRVTGVADRQTGLARRR